MENLRFFSDALDIDEVVEVDEVGVEGPLVRLALFEFILEVDSSSIALCNGVTVHLFLLSSLMADGGLAAWLVTTQLPLVDPVELSLWIEGLW